MESIRKVLTSNKKATACVGVVVLWILNGILSNMQSALTRTIIGDVVTTVVPTSKEASRHVEAWCVVDSDFTPPKK